MFSPFVYFYDYCVNIITFLIDLTIVLTILMTKPILLILISLILKLKKII